MGSDRPRAGPLRYLKMRYSQVSDVNDVRLGVNGVRLGVNDDRLEAISGRRA